MDQFQDIVTLLQSVQSVVGSNTSPRVRCWDDPRSRTLGFIYGDDPGGPAFTINLTHFKASCHLLPERLREEFKSIAGRTLIASLLEQGLGIDQMEQKLPELSDEA
jgi:hypothetical protein